MLKNITVKNFKTLKDVNLPLSNLNLLAGTNGMGKSSLIQTLLMLHQSDYLNEGRLLLNSPRYIELGKAKDIFYQYSNDDYIYLRLTSARGSEYEWKFHYEPEADQLSTDKIYLASQLIEESLFNNNFIYLSAERIGPQATYTMSTTEVAKKKQLGKKGEYAVHYLNLFGTAKIENKTLIHKKSKSKILSHVLDAWLGEITPGVKLNTREIPGANLILLDFQFETSVGQSVGSLTNPIHPVNVGFGLIYVLPIILSLLTVNKDKLIIIENPEAHIHPRGQTELGKLLAIAAQTGAQIFVETHSDHILNGVRVAVKEGLISAEKSKIFYFQRDIKLEEHFSEIIPISIDSKGELSEYPKNFMDEWSNQLIKLI